MYYVCVCCDSKCDKYGLIEDFLESGVSLPNVAFVKRIHRAATRTRVGFCKLFKVAQSTDYTVMKD